MTNLNQSYISLQVHDHRRYNYISPWTLILIFCALFTIACVHLDHAFPFDLTQLYSTSNKEHTSGISLSTMQHFADQKSMIPRRRQMKPKIATTTTAATTTTTTTATSAPTTFMTTTTRTSRVTTKAETTMSIPKASPPYTLNELVTPRTKTPKGDANGKNRSKSEKEEKSRKGEKVPGKSADSQKSKNETTLILIQNHKQRKMTPFPKQSEVLVTTAYGQVQGMKGDVMGKDVSAFIGIPYARKPTGKFRFKRTVSPKPWTDVLTTQSFKPHCIQSFRDDILLSRSLTTLYMSEDCLYLNIWSPDMESRNHKPVLVWLHGGGFSSGTANLDETDGRVLAALGDVVVVTFNFRLGSLGFLDLQSEEAPGNQGLYDIIEALKFVQQNIAAFGGDKHRVTLIGQDSGAVTVGAFLTSPIAKGLFNRAIVQSGSPLFQDYFEEKNSKSSESLLSGIGCATCETLKDKLKCLRDKTVMDILSVQKPLLHRDHHLFGPTFCEQLLPDSVIDALYDDSTRLNVREVLMGSNRDELTVSLVLDYPQMFNRKRIDLNITTLQELRSLVLKIFSQNGGSHSASTQYLVDFFFTGGEETDSTENLIRRMYRVFGDAAVGCPVHIFAEQLVKKGVKVYLYEFNQRAQNMVWGAWMGVPIGTEIPYIFGHPLRYPKVYSKDDLAISQRLIATWTQFAYNGTVPQQLDQTWDEFTKEKSGFLEINPREAIYGSRSDNGVCNMFRLALKSRNQNGTRIDCTSRVISGGDEIDLDEDLYETTTADNVTMEELSTMAPTEPPLISCPLFTDDLDGPSIEYYDYKVIDLKIVPIIGSRAVFFCDVDMDLIGNQILTCLSAGSWSSEEPVCQKTTPESSRNRTAIPAFSCDLLQEPLRDHRLRVEYENLYVINETRRFAVRGSLAKFKCFPMNAVDKVRLVGSDVIECSKYGIWSAIEPHCEVVIEGPKPAFRDFSEEFFLIGLILVITLSLIFVSAITYSKLSVREYSVSDFEKKYRKQAQKVRRSLEQLPIDATREESELLQINREFNDDELSPEDLEVISILSKARYNRKREIPHIGLLDYNMNRKSQASGAISSNSKNDSESVSSSSPETVLWVQR